jgi:N-acetyl-anhydromuramyl-L-alanine amidase AmpD
MADTDPASKASVKDGKLVAPGGTIVEKLFPKIDKGAMTTVHAIVVHQTGGKTADSSFGKYKSGTEGAHFLIDKDGTIYQTARVDRMCWHVGKIQSRCYSLKSCDVDELKEIKSILYKKGDSYSARVSKLNEHEQEKEYPDRFPTNSDAIGIELVGAYTESGGYEAATDEQNESLAWLVAALETALGLSSSDLYRHPEVSYKQATEAESAKW